MKDNKEKPVLVKAPANMTVYDPDKPLYERRHLCVYLRELLDEAEKQSDDASRERQEETGGVR